MPMHDANGPNLPIVNFGGNLRFKPRNHYTPSTEAEVLAILDRHAHGKVRVVGALHSWSPAVVCEDAIVDLRHFNGVHVERTADGTVWTTVGGGCRIKRLLRKLHRLSDATIPSLGLVTEQTIGGAIATATHGSGKHSMSHYIAEVRVAAYDPASGAACIYTWNDGAQLRAARCALGCMGIILSVRIRCVPKYDVAETMVPCATLDEVLALESDFPLQQFYLTPHRWSYFAQRRAVAPEHRPRRTLAAKLFRVWWFVGTDVGLHHVITLLADKLRSPRLIRFFFRHVLPRLVLTNRTVVDHSDQMLVMEHELFKHLEMEVFVPARHLAAAMDFVRTALEVFDGALEAPGGAMAAMLDGIGMLAELATLRGTFTHHYPICVRRVLADDTLISMSSGDETWYAISFITYVEPRAAFFAMASFLARSMANLFRARLHWGKHFPLSAAEVEATYPRQADFRALCRRVDPHGVFRNEFTDRVLHAS